MTAGLADAAMSRIRGLTDAQNCIDKIRRECSHGELLLEALKAVLATGDAVRLAGFARELERFIERAT